MHTHTRTDNPILKECGGRSVTEIDHQYHENILESDQC